MKKESRDLVASAGHLCEYSNHLSEVMSCNNPKLNCCKISLNTFTDRVVWGLRICGFAIIKLAMSSKLLSGYEDVWRHSWDSLCIVRFRITQNGKHGEIEKA